jgi:hypothetical protein
MKLCVNGNFWFALLGVFIHSAANARSIVEMTFDTPPAPNPVQSAVEGFQTGFQFGITARELRLRSEELSLIRDQEALQRRKESEAAFLQKEQKSWWVVVPGTKDCRQLSYDFDEFMLHFDKNYRTEVQEDKRGFIHIRAYANGSTKPEHWYMAEERIDCEKNIPYFKRKM